MSKQNDKIRVEFEEDLQYAGVMLSGDKNFDIKLLPGFDFDFQQEIIQLAKHLQHERHKS